jgi:hypothetical protein
MNDQHVVACAMIFQDILLTANVLLITWYLWETRELRRAAQAQVTKSQSQISATHEQVEVMRRQVTIAQDQLEAQIRPALTLAGKGATFWVVNIGNGSALNLQLVKGRSQTPYLSASSKVDSNFGRRIKGICVAPGDSQAKDTYELIGSFGQVNGEDVQLVYESLSGKRYISMIDFDGTGSPCKTTLHISQN